MHRPDPTILVLVLGVVWVLVALVVVGYPLLSGRMRFGGPGSEPITREGDPQAFWTAYAISTGLFVLLSAGVGWFVLSKVLV